MINVSLYVTGGGPVVVGPAVVGPVVVEGGVGPGPWVAKYAPAATAAIITTITIAACTRVIALLDNFHFSTNLGIAISYSAFI